jgi:hypothetical protein
MKYSAYVTVVVAALSSGAFAQSSVCSGLSGQDRRTCLEGEVKRGQAETARIERNNRRLDRAKDATCLTRDFGGHLASGAGYAKGGKAGAVAGNVAYRAGTGALDRVLDNPHACTPRAR